MVHRIEPDRPERAEIELLAVDRRRLHQQPGTGSSAAAGSGSRRNGRRSVAATAEHRPPSTPHPDRASAAWLPGGKVPAPPGTSVSASDLAAYATGWNAAADFDTGFGSLPGSASPATKGPLPGRTGSSHPPRREFAKGRSFERQKMGAPPLFLIERLPGGGVLVAIPSRAGGRSRRRLAAGATPAEGTLPRTGLQIDKSRQNQPSHLH